MTTTITRLLTQDINQEPNPLITRLSEPKTQPRNLNPEYQCPSQPESKREPCKPNSKTLNSIPNSIAKPCERLALRRLQNASRASQGFQEFRVYAFGRLQALGLQSFAGYRKYTVWSYRFQELTVFRMFQGHRASNLGLSDLRLQGSRVKGRGRFYSSRCRVQSLDLRFDWF